MSIKWHNNIHAYIIAILYHSNSWITLENGKTTTHAMGVVWRGLEVMEMASWVGEDMLVSANVVTTNFFQSTPH